MLTLGPYFRSFVTIFSHQVTAAGASVSSAPRGRGLLEGGGSREMSCNAAEFLGL